MGRKGRDLLSREPEAHLRGHSGQATPADHKDTNVVRADLRNSSRCSIELNGNIHTLREPIRSNVGERIIRRTIPASGCSIEAVGPVQQKPETVLVRQVVERLVVRSLQNVENSSISTIALLVHVHNKPYDIAPADRLRGKGEFNPPINLPDRTLPTNAGVFSNALRDQRTGHRNTACIGDHVVVHCRVKEFKFAVQNSMDTTILRKPLAEPGLFRLPEVPTPQRLPGMYPDTRTDPSHRRHKEATHFNLSFPDQTGTFKSRETQGIFSLVKTEGFGTVQG